MKRKSLAILLSGLMLGSLVLAGCGGSSSDSTSESTGADSASESTTSESTGADSTSTSTAEGGSNLEESKALLQEAIDTLMTTDNHQMMAEGVVMDVPEAEGTAEELEALDVAEAFQNRGFGGIPIQIGYCNGHNKKLNAVEYHRCSEINVAVTDLVLLIGSQQDITDDFHYDTSRIEAFLVPLCDDPSLCALPCRRRRIPVRSSPCKRNQHRHHLPSGKIWRGQADDRKEQMAHRPRRSRDRRSLQWTRRRKCFH